MRWDPVSRQFRVFEKGGGGTSTTTTQPTYTPAEARARAQVLSIAERIFRRNKNPGPYPGAVPVTMNSATKEGHKDLLHWADHGGKKLAKDTSRFSHFLMGDSLKAESNPYLQSHISAAIRPVQEEYTDPGGVFSSIRTSSINAGPSTRQGIAEGIAGGRYLQTVGDISARMAGENYQNALRAGTQALALAPQTAAVGQAPALAESAVGTHREGYQRERNEYAADRREWNINKDWLPLQNFANIVYGGSMPGTTVTQYGDTKGPSTASSALGGAATGAMIGSSIMPGYGTAIGAGVGLLAGLFM